MTDPDRPRSFVSPQEAVEVLGRLLEAEDWAGMSRYYDLSGTGIDPGRLRSGEFFVRAAPPEGGHPAGFSRYLHPFAPGFRYASHRLEGEDAVVTVAIQIDQGDGMIQRGFHEFRLRNCPSGWRVRPEPAS